MHNILLTSTMVSSLTALGIKNIGKTKSKHITLPIPLRLYIAVLLGTKYWFAASAICIIKPRRGDTLVQPKNPLPLYHDIVRKNPIQHLSDIRTLHHRK
jgi:hypothetical protein